MSETLNLSQNSRYKDTRVFRSADGTVLTFGLPDPPEEFRDEQDDFKLHSVTASEIGFLDRLAARYYGQGNEDLWWVIALANAIIDPERDLTPGDRLVIPSRAAVLRFSARVGNAY